MKVGSFCLAMNLVLNILLIIPLKQCGLALATTICAYLNVGLLAILLIKDLRPFKLPLYELMYSCLKIVVCLIGTGIILYFIKGKIFFDTDYHFLLKLQQLFIPAVVGLLSYIVISIITGSREPFEIASNFRIRNGN